MKTEQELNKEILQTTLDIQENHPELLPFVDEMTPSTPSEESPAIENSNLAAFNDSLHSMVDQYTKHAKKHIIIIGAGFAGLKLARELNNHPNYTITLIDKNNYHQFQPLFYQVAMAQLDASNISFPLRSIFQKSKNLSIRVATVTNVNTVNNTVAIGVLSFHYDYLVIATGAVTNYFGNEAIASHSFSMKSTFDALEIRNSLLQHFEDAITHQHAITKRNLSIVIVGGGPTGVELSGTLAEMKTDSLPLEYPELNFAQMDIFLLEGSPKLLAAMRPASSSTAKTYLENLGVTVKLNCIVKTYDGAQVFLNDGTTLDTSFVIWAAGVKGNIPAGVNPDFITHTNQLKTDRFHGVATTSNVFALGDAASIQSEAYLKGYPQLASVAIDQANNLANNFKRLAKGKAALPYQYVNKGSMATVGRHKAVVDLAKPNLTFHGFFAWFIWMTLHLFLLIGFKNRLIVFINWMYKYYTHRQSLALLFPALASKKSAVE